MRLTLLGLIVLIAVRCAEAQSFTYSNFTGASGLVLNGNAAFSGAALRVSNAALSTKGSAFFGNPVSVAYGFETTFTFQFTSPSGGGADGMAFIIQNDPRGTAALANHAGALGYGAFVGSPAGTAIANSVAIEIDTFQGNATVGDLSGNEIAVHTGSTGDNTHFAPISAIGRVAVATPNMSTGVHTFRIHYEPGTLTIYLDNLTTPVLTVPYDFATGGTLVTSGAPIGGLSLLGGEYAWVGFTASAGASWENHDVLSWTFDSPLPGPAFDGTVGAGLGGPYNVLTIGGNAGGLLRTVNVPVATGFSVDLATPPTNPFPANFYLCVLVGVPLPYDAYPLPAGIGDFVFPIPFPGSVPPGTAVVAETYGLGAGIVGALPTPWTLPVVSGIPFPLAVTFQGVIEEQPGILRTTNAVILNIL